MNQQESISLMKSSISVHDWNKKRDLVLEALKEENKEYTHDIEIDHTTYALRTFIPKWFFNEIDCSRLICEVLKK